MEIKEILYDKVQLFREGNKNLILRYIITLVKSKKVGRFLQSFVTFIEYMDFKHG